MKASYELGSGLTAEERQGVSNLLQEPSSFFAKKYQEGKTIYQNFCKAHNKEHNPKHAERWAVAWCNSYRLLQNEEKEQKELMERLKRL